MTDDDDEDEVGRPGSWAVDDVRQVRRKASIGDSGGEEKFRRGPDLVSPGRSQQYDESWQIWCQR